MSTNERPWIIVGAGRMGRLLGAIAQHLDIPVRCAFNLTAAGSEAARRAFVADHYLFDDLALLAPHLQEPGVILWITTRDAQLVGAAAAIAGLLEQEAASTPMSFHCAGAFSSELLRKVSLPAPVASLHPLLAITEATEALEAATRARWTVEGDDEAVAYALALMARLGVEPVRIAPEAKILYHCAAVMAANLLVALEDAAFEVARTAGLSPEQARDMLLPLAHSSLENLAALPPEQALSGPAARGDMEVIARHREALARLGDPGLARVYEVLIERALALGRHQ